MSLVAAGAMLVLLGGLSAILARRHARVADRLFGILVVAGCLAETVAALRALTGPVPAPWTFMPNLPGAAWQMGLDGLSAWFLLLLATAGGLATSFGVTYMRAERAHRPVAIAHATWALLLAAMIGVLTSRSALPFLLAWEAMAVSAYLLIMFEHEHEEVRRSGLLYLVLTHLGTLALIVMFLTWGRAAGGLSFADFAAVRGRLSWAGAGVLWLALFGFGVKAGAFPFHFWLPGAHAAAPSHVSALLSGVMLKIGIYGLLRVVTLVGTPPAWWGWTLLLLGLASAVLGVLWALAQRDLKRLLAYSSVENIGIILMGMGLGALGCAYRQPGVALLGYAGALLHTLNHALFKCLLFLGAGAGARATGTREIDRLGGLARRMPRTALLFLIGSVAIVGLPPLNGFVSEWLLVRGFLHAGQDGGTMRMAALGTAGLALVAGLAVACFLRLVGVAFTGVPRDQHVAGAQEATRGMLVPMMALAAGCALVGLAPEHVMRIAERPLGALLGASSLLPEPPRYALESGAGLRLLGVSVLALSLAAWGALRLAAARSTRAATWACAFVRSTPHMQYTAASFGAPLLRAFPRGPAGETPGASRALGSLPEDFVMRSLVRPVWNRIEALARAVRPLQQGRVTGYLQYMIWTVLLLLGFLVVATPGGGR